jgi:hypothetical protein
VQLVSVGCGAPGAWSPRLGDVGRDIVTAVRSPASGTASLVLWLLAAGAALSAVAALSSFAEASILKRLIGGGFVPDTEIEASDSRQALIGILQLTLGIVSAIAFLVWTYGARKSLDALGVRGMRFSPRSSVGWFFVPIANLWKPYQAIAEIWRASDPERDAGQAESWREAPVPPLFLAWWGVFLIWGALDRVVLRTVLAVDPTPQQILDGSRLTALNDALGGVAALLAFVVVRIIARRQDAAFARAPVTSPLPA